MSASDVEQFDEEDGSVDLDYDDMPPLQSPDCSDDEEDFTDEVYRVYNNRVQPPRKAKAAQSVSPTVVTPTASSEPLSWEVKADYLSDSQLDRGSSWDQQDHPAASFARVQLAALS